MVDFINIMGSFIKIMDNFSEFRVTLFLIQFFLRFFFQLPRYVLKLCPESTCACCDWRTDLHGVCSGRVCLRTLVTVS